MRLSRICTLMNEPVYRRTLTERRDLTAQKSEATYTVDYIGGAIHVGYSFGEAEAPAEE